MVNKILFKDEYNIKTEKQFKTLTYTENKHTHTHTHLHSPKAQTRINCIEKHNTETYLHICVYVKNISSFQGMLVKHPIPN